VRDYAALELGFAVLLICAVIWFERRLVVTTGAAFLAGTLPHLAYHLTTTDRLSTADNAGSLGSVRARAGAGRPRHGERRPRTENRGIYCVGPERSVVSASADR
jgi:hypothetical protein